MSISAPIALTVGAEVYSLPFITGGNYAGTYYDVSAAGTERLTVTVRHTIPSGSGNVESHLVRCDLDYLDADGAVERTDSAWMVLKSSGSAQNTTELKDLAVGMTAMLEASTNAVLLKVLGRES